MSSHCHCPVLFHEFNVFRLFLDGPGVWFKSLADCEPADTYLKVHYIYILIYFPTYAAYNNLI